MGSTSTWVCWGWNHLGRHQCSQIVDNSRPSGTTARTIGQIPRCTTSRSDELVYELFLPLCCIINYKGWNPFLVLAVVLIGPISNRFRPSDRTIYSRKDGCSQRVDNSRPSSTTAKTKKGFHHYRLFPIYITKGCHKRNQVHRPNIKPVLAIR